MNMTQMYLQLKNGMLNLKKIYFSVCKDVMAKPFMRSVKGVAGCFLPNIHFICFCYGANK